MLTQRQHELLHFISDYQRANGGVSHSFAEMMVGIGATSKSRIHSIIERLEARGFIRRIHGKERAIRICGDQSLASIPDATLLAECERRGLLNERRDAAPVATSRAGVSRPLGGASARTSPSALGTASADDCAGEVSNLSPECLPSAFSRSFHSSSNS